MEWNLLGRLEMKIKVQLLSPRAQMPTRGSEDAAGWDLYAAIDYPVTIKSGENFPIPTDLALEIPSGYWGGIYARSGNACKRGLRLSNSVGVIDSDFRGCVTVSIYNDSTSPRVIKPGDRIAQLIIHKSEDVEFETVKHLTDTERGIGGFGSTGLN